MGFGAFLVTFCASKKLPGARGRVAPEATSLGEEEIPFAPKGKRKHHPPPEAAKRR